MTALVVNLVLVFAVLALLLIWAISASRRRRHERRQHAAERRLILQAFTGAAQPPSSPPPAAPLDADSPPATGTAPALDAASIAALLDLLDDRREPRRGLLGSLITSPRTVWAAGSTAGQQLGRRTMGETRTSSQASDLYREAAAELVELHVTDPGAAQREYQAYAEALGDPAIAQLYLRSAAITTYTDPGDAHQIVEAITGAQRLKELSDGPASIEP